jgi:hypothetical protein
MACVICHSAVWAAAALAAVRRAGVQAVLEHVKVERTEVFGAVHLQLADDRMEFVDVVVPQDLGLQLGGPRQGVAVDLQQLVGRHGVQRRGRSR